MPQLGEVKRVVNNGKSQGKYIWAACEKCGMPRWVQLVKGKPRRTLCRKHSFEKPYSMPKGTIKNPVEGDIRYNAELGLNYGNRRRIWFVCPICGESFWTDCRRGKPRIQKCRKCCIPKWNSSKYQGTITNPILGDIRQGKDVGRNDTSLYIYQACADCGKERWVAYRLKRKSAIVGKCLSCSLKGKIQPRGEQSHGWKGGRRRSRDGYIVITIFPDNFFYSMGSTRGVNGRQVLEHRLVMAKSIGRCLQNWEVVHHKNGVKDDNRIENLELTCSNAEHIKNHGLGYKDGYAKGYYEGKSKRIQELETIIEELKRNGRKDSPNDNL